MRLQWHQRTIYHDEQWAKVLRRDPCVYCGAKSDSVEHVDPRGSRSCVKNGVGACRSCNSERGSVPLLYYLVWRSGDRLESFYRWNFRMNAERIRESQLRAKARRLAEKNPPPEERARELRISIAERIGLWSDPQPEAELIAF